MPATSLLLIFVALPFALLFSSPDCLAIQSKCSIIYKGGLLVPMNTEVVSQRCYALEHLFPVDDFFHRIMTTVGMSSIVDKSMNQHFHFVN